MKIRIAIFFALMFFQSMASANPDSMWSNCYDVTGRPVLLVDDPGSMRFEATFHDFEPTIVWDSDVSGEISPEAETFLYAHACAHHSLGHTFSLIPEDGEERADCWAANTLINVGIFYEEDLLGVAKELNEKPENIRNLAGLHREINLVACFNPTRKISNENEFNEFEPLCSLQMVEEEYEDVETSIAEDQIPCEHCTCLRWGQCLCDHDFDTITRTVQEKVIRTRFVPKEVCEPNTALDAYPK